LHIESDERDTPRREDLKRAAATLVVADSDGDHSGIGTTRERPVNRSGIRPLERARARASGAN
jgi:hypothetical protein